MGRGHFPDRVLLFFPSQGVDDRYLSVDTGETKHLLDVAVIVLGTSKGKKAIPGNVRISFQDFQSCRTERNPYRNRPSFLGFTRYVFDGAIDHVTLLHLEKVSNPAADETVKDEDVPLYGELGMSREICPVYPVALLNRDIVGCTVYTFSDGELCERVIVRVTIGDVPENNSP